MLGFVAFLVMVAGWFFIAKQLKKKGLGGITRHLAGGALGALLFLLTPAVYFSFSGDSAPLVAKQPEQQGHEAPTEQTAPESTKGEMWKFLVNNAARTINRYAYDTNPDAVILGRDGQVDFELQQSGEHEGRYLLTLTDYKDDNKRVVTLLPLFDEYASSDDLDDEAELWKILEATLNGRPFDAAAEPVAAAEWYEGGTLHSASALEWQQASQANKLATAADIAAVAYKNKLFKPEIQNAVTGVNSFLPLATGLVEGLDATFEPDPDPETNRVMFSNQKVNETSVMLMMTMGWLK